MKRKASYLGNNIPASTWEKLKKRAHDVWDLGTEGERVLALRKKQDTAKVSKEQAPTEARGLQESGDTAFSDGDLVLFFMGGHRIEAKVVGGGDGYLDVDTGTESITGVPSEWCKLAQVPSKCACRCGCAKVADGSLGKCKNCLMVGCG